MPEKKPEKKRDGFSLLQRMTSEAGDRLTFFTVGALLVFVGSVSTINILFQLGFRLGSEEVVQSLTTENLWVLLVLITGATITFSTKKTGLWRWSIAGIVFSGALWATSINLYVFSNLTDLLQLFSQNPYASFLTLAAPSIAASGLFAGGIINFLTDEENANASALKTLRSFSFLGATCLLLQFAYSEWVTFPDLSVVFARELVVIIWMSILVVLVTASYRTPEESHEIFGHPKKRIKRDKREGSKWGYCAIFLGVIILVGSVGSVAKTAANLSGATNWVNVTLLALGVASVAAAALSFVVVGLSTKSKWDRKFLGRKAAIIFLSGSLFVLSDAIVSYWMLFEVTTENNSGDFFSAVGETMEKLLFSFVWLVVLTSGSFLVLLRDYKLGEETRARFITPVFYYATGVTLVASGAALVALVGSFRAAVPFESTMVTAPIFLVFLMVSATVMRGGFTQLR